MNKRDLWEKFTRTGKVSDYLKYKSAPYDNLNGYETEVAQELYPDDPGPEEVNYDFDEDGWYGDPRADYR